MRVLKRQARTHSIFILRMTRSTDSRCVTGIRADVPCLNAEMGKLERMGVFVTVLGNWEAQAQRAGFYQGPSCFSILWQKTGGAGEFKNKERDTATLLTNPLLGQRQQPHKNRSDSPVSSKCCCLQCAAQELAAH